MGRAAKLALLTILLLAAALRVYRLGDLPAGLYCDEAALGYNAYSIVKTGCDENGVRFPLFFWSFGVSYKNPVYIYAATVPVAVLGLDEFSLRLTSAAFGVATVAAVFFLCQALFSTGVGLLAAFALTICPWHLQFSRIGFELISFPLLFSIGVTLLVRFAQGRRTLPAAFLFFGLCSYAYAIANLFVPLFLAGFAVLYVDRLWRHWRQTLLALGVIVAVVAPVLHFDLVHHVQAGAYFKNTTFIEPSMSWGEVAQHFGRNYVQFFSHRFLFEDGDKILSHAVRGHGELYPAFLPLLLLGGAVALLRRDRAAKLILLWLALYPVGASLMTEIPSASRGFIGVVPFCVLVALGAGSVLWALALVLRNRSLALAAQTAALVVGAFVLAPQVWHYLDLYFHEYARYSAPYIEGFQYGYRDMIRYMEAQRPNYPRLLLTATRVNRPYIFTLFYRPVDPATFHRTRDIGYDILDPAEISRYGMDRPILYGLRPDDLHYFSDYTIKKRIVAPGGQVPFVVAELRARKHYLTHWLSLGPFDNRDNHGIRRDEILPAELDKDSRRGLCGDVYWHQAQRGFLRVDLNQFPVGTDPDSPSNPEHVCAYNYTRIRSATAQSGFLEMEGSEDWARVWLNGAPLEAQPVMLRESAQRFPVELRQGDNQLLVKSCEDIGEWYFVVRLTDDAGNDLSGIEDSAVLPPQPEPPPAAPVDSAQLQVVEGFGTLIRASQTFSDYPDYRGSSPAWREYFGDPAGEIVWRSSACPASKPTTLVFTASLGDPPGEADLYVNGEYALSFATDEKPGDQGGPARRLPPCIRLQEDCARQLRRDLPDRAEAHGDGRRTASSCAWSTQAVSQSHGSCSAVIAIPPPSSTRRRGP